MTNIEALTRSRSLMGRQHVSPVARRAAQVSSRRGSLLICLLIASWFAATAWMRPLMLPDEGRYAGVAFEMIRSRDWLTPTLNGLPFFHKPPLFYWITAASMAAFGSHELAARTASILGATVGALAMYLFTRHWVSPRMARLVLLALVVQPLFYIGAQFANLDMLVAGCITVTILAAAHAALSFDAGRPYRVAVAGAYAAAAAGVLAKGLIGAVLPALTIAAWLLVLRRPRSLRVLVWWPGVLLFLLIAAPWFLAMQARFAGFLNYFFVVQQFQRFAAGGFNNVQPFWFYPALLVLVTLPWVGWIWRGMATRPASINGAEPVRLLMVLWLIVVVGFFSLPESKLVGYVLPAIPPLAALMAFGYLRHGEPSPRERRFWMMSTAVAAVLSLAIVGGLAQSQDSSTRALARVLKTEVPSAAPVFMVEKYEYDVALFAGLPEPVRVVDDWQAPEIGAHDNERKEAADAAQFAPRRAASILISRDAFAPALCQAAVAWVIGQPRAATRYAFLQRATIAFSGREATLWKVDTSEPDLRGALGCAGTGSPQDIEPEAPRSLADPADRYAANPRRKMQQRRKG